MSPDEIDARMGLARERLDVARVLLEAGHLRDAANRAYYAMFHAAHALVRTRGEDPRTHRGLAHVLAETFADELTGDEMASFRSAQEIREESDYVTGTDPDAEDVRTVLEDAERFVARAEEILESF